MPNILVANRKENVTVYAQLLSQGRGKITLGITYLGTEPNLSLDGDWVPQVKSIISF